MIGSSSDQNLNETTLDAIQNDKTFLLLAELDTEPAEYLTRAAIYYLKNKPSAALELMESLLSIFTQWFEQDSNINPEFHTQSIDCQDSDLNLNMKNDHFHPPVILFTLFDEISDEFVKLAGTVFKEKLGNLDKELRKNMKKVMHIWTSCIGVEKGSLSAA